MAQPGSARPGPARPGAEGWPPGDRGAHPARAAGAPPRAGSPRGAGGYPGVFVWHLGLGAVGLAPADLHADRAGAPVPARAGQRARVGAAAAGDRPAGGAAVLRRSPVAGAPAGPAVAVQRLRVALVRRDLPAAVRLARGVRDPSHVPAGRLGAAAAAAGTGQPGPAAA